MSPDEQALPSAATRFDKHGNQLPESRHGCGCQICADAHAARSRPRRPWTRLVQFVKRVTGDGGRRPQAA